jgi:hypothetical protein
VSVPAAGPFLRLENDTVSGCTTPDSVALSITGDIDIRIDMQLTDYTPCVLAAKYVTASNNRSWAIVLNGDGTIGWWWSPDGINVTQVSSTVPVPLGRLALRVVFTVALSEASWFTGPAGGADGSLWTQLGPTLAFGTGTSIYNSTAEVGVARYAGVNTDNADYQAMNGQVWEFEIRNGVAGTVVGDPVFSAQSAGATSFIDAEGNTWTLTGTSELSGRSYRFHGECSSLPQAWDNTGTDVWTPVAAAGQLRRMGQGNAPLQSSLKRAILAQTGALAPVAYWPAEDLSGSTSIASAIGGPAMTVFGSASFAANSDFLCSNPLPTLGGSAWRGAIPAYTSDGSIVVRFLLEVPSGGDANAAVAVRTHCTGTVGDLTMYYGTASGGSLRLAGWQLNGGGNVFDSGYVTFAVDGEQLWVSLELTPAGGNVDYQIVTLEPGASSGLSFSGSFAGAIGNAISVQVNPNGSLSGTVLGHLSVQSEWVSLFSLFSALDAWQGETAGNRVARLCAENGYASRIIGYPDTTVAMGPQSPETLQALLQECEDADHGMLFEPRTSLAIGYLTQVALLGQAAAVTLDYAAKELAGTLTPIDDDQYTMNDMLATRGSGAVSGSGFQATLNDGSPMSISPPPVGVGDYSSTKTVNVLADSQMPDAAWWLVHLGTVNEERYPAVTVDMARSQITGNSSLFYAVQDAVDIGAYVGIANPPAWLPPGTIKQLVSGTTEVLGGYFYASSWNTIPESPYEVMTWDDAVYGWDTDGSTLHTGITSSATSMSVATTNPLSPLWTTLAADLPFSVMMGGEEIEVTAISGSSSPQAFTVVRSVNGVAKAHTAGEDVRLYPTPVYAML